MGKKKGVFGWGSVVLLLLAVSMFAMAQTPTQGGILQIAIDGTAEPAVMDAHFDPYNSAWLMSSFFADNLAFRDYDGVVKPHLATGWEVTEDGLTWTLYLREDVRFQDGTPFNADAVVANFDRVTDPANPTPLTTSKLGPITSVEATDEFTVVVHYSSPWASFLNTLSLGCFPIWSPTALEKYGQDEWYAKLVGSGPFILTEWVPGSHVAGVRNPDYNSAPPCMGQDGPVYLDGVVFTWVTENAVRGMVLKTGEADVCMYLPPEYASVYDGDSNFNVFTQAAPGTGMASVFNTDDPILSDIRVRRAILHTIDQEEINQIAYGGTLLASDGVINPITPGYNPIATTTVMYPHSLDKARQLLEEAGWVLNHTTGIREKDGVPLELTWAAIHHEEMGEVAKEQLKEIGIELEVLLVPGPIQLDMVSTRNFNLMYERMRGPDIEYLDMCYNSANDPLIAPGGWAWTGFHSDELDRLLNATAQTFDQDLRMRMFEAAQMIIMENAIMLPVLAETVYWGNAMYVNNFAIHSSGLGFNLYTVWMDK